MTTFQLLKAQWFGKGGAKGIAVFMAFLVLLIAPPFAVLEVIDAPPFTLQRILVPAVWTIYWLVGMARSKPTVSATFMDVLSLAVWPLHRKR